MEFFNITDPHYTDALKTAVGCMVSLDSADAELVPFTACVDDIEDYGRMLFQDLIAGKHGKIQPFIELPLSLEEIETVKSNKLNASTAKINTLQDAVDLGIATDAEVASLTVWRTYRVLLNRVDTSMAPDVIWPETPEG